ncbi:Dabb family protein [Aquibacillus salsiterrae]|uniref:Dabb family protein n=1 Tax=Aquibacillus salsiterrae TaxID=2950439 RepID=A0A9X3WD45_9BACI|nr:Dabb family protein [Aquibacillus salsiterrae]MDC3417402.1 Dabb family protein [Aquibacillus salsiterrae]
MMYEHMVYFKFNDQITSDKQNELLDKLHAFKGVIPGIVEITAGINATTEQERARGYSMGLRVTFENKDALDQYGPHPVHQEFVQSLEGVIDHVAVVDYPINK